MSTIEITPESLREFANKWVGESASDAVLRRSMRERADRLERERNPLPTVPGWYPGIVVERGGESCTGALLTDEGEWITSELVLGCHHHEVDSRSTTIRWAEQDGTTPGQTLWEANSGNPTHTWAWNDLSVVVLDRYERIAAAVLAAHGTPTLTPVGEHPEPGTHGLLPVTFNERDGNWHFNRTYICRSLSPMADVILADPRPDGAHE